MARELREPIFRLVAENATWGAPRIHGELKMLGYNISERTALALDAGKHLGIPSLQDNGPRS